MSVPDLYSILNLDKSILKLPDEQIQKIIEDSYNSKVKECHPDKFMKKTKIEKEKASKTFEMITEAYEILKNKDTRSSYNKIYEKIDTLDGLAQHDNLKAASLNYLGAMPLPDNKSVLKGFSEQDYYAKLSPADAEYYKEKVSKCISKKSHDLLKEAIREREEYDKNFAGIKYDRNIEKNINNIYYKADNLYTGIVKGDNNSTYGDYNSTEYGSYKLPLSYVDISGKFDGMKMDDFKNKTNEELNLMMLEKLKERSKFTDTIEKTDFNKQVYENYGGAILDDTISQELLLSMEDTLNEYNEIKNRY
jgi:curved DNA-binding protein CbpA